MDNTEKLLNKLKTEVDSNDSSLSRELLVDELKRYLDPILLECTQLMVVIASMATGQNKQFIVKLSLEETELLSKHLEDTPWSGVAITTDDIRVLSNVIDYTIADVLTELSDLKPEDSIEPLLNKIRVISELVNRSVTLTV